MENTRKSFEYMQLLARLYGIANDDTFQVRNPFAGHSGSRRSFYHKSHMIPTRLGTDGIAALVNFTNEILTGSLPYHSYLAMTPLGGVITNPLRPSAFDDQRNSLAIAEYGGSWTTPNQDFHLVRHQRKFHDAMTDFWGNGAFYNYKDNYLGGGDEDWGEAYWGGMIPRLRNIKCRYYHLGIFSMSKQSIEAWSSCTIHLSDLG